MSDRRRRSHEDYLREPVIIERRPQVRTYRITRESSPKRERLTFGDKLYNLFRRSKSKRRVEIIEEIPIRSRRTERRSWDRPSTSSGPYHTMLEDPEDDIFTPLPPKLPPKSKAKKHDSKHYVLEEREPQRYRKVKVVNVLDDHFDDVEAHPRVESASPPQKRDSGKYFMHGARGSDDLDAAYVEYERVRPDPETERLRAELDRLRRERRDAETAAKAAKDEASRYKAELEYEKRHRSLEKRERQLAEREKQINRERDRLVEVRRPREQRDVVVVNPPSAAVVPARDNNRTALDRARDDYQRGQQVEVRRPVTGDRRARGQSIIIVDDDEQDRNRHHDRDRRRR
jgi:hypothetical protein